MQILRVSIFILIVFIAICCYNTNRSNISGAGEADIFKFSMRDKNELNILLTELFRKTQDKKDLKTALVVNDIPYSIPYAPQYSIIKFGNHFGQRKLGLSEIQFLTEWSKISKEKVYCVYAGSAPSNKTHILTEMFPNVDLILIDPNKFEIMINDPKTGDVKSHRKISSQKSDIIHLISHYETKSKEFKRTKDLKVKDLTDADTSELASFVNRDNKHRIYIIEDYFDTSGEIIASFLRKLDRKIIFISDIRSSVVGDSPTDFDIIWNSAMMFNWIKNIRPEYSMIKFRLPFFGDNSVEEKEEYDKNTFELSKKNGIDFISDRANKQFKLFGGMLFLQAWPGRSSTELRLHTKKHEIDSICQLRC
jgi:hypothetical protein